MPKLNQKGVVHVILLLLLLGGIAATVWLVTAGPLKLLPKASVSGPVGPETSMILSDSRPETTPKVIGTEFRLDLFVRSDIDPANLFVAKLQFPPDLLEIVSIDKNESSEPQGFVVNWVEEYFDNQTGSISLVGGVPSPGHQTNWPSASLMATLVFRAKTAGSANITFNDESAIYRNSDNLNILNIKNNATVTISATGVPSPSACPTPPACKEGEQLIYGDPDPSNPDQCPRYACSPSPIPTDTPSPTPIPASTAYQRVFVTSTAYTSDLGGVSGADTKCQSSANAANLGGTWEAWISDSGVNTAASRLSHSTVAYKLLNGTTVANNWTDLIDGSLTNPININEKGEVAYTPTSGFYVWTGTRYNGERIGYTCSDWTTTNAYGVIGSSRSVDATWSNVQNYSGGTGNYCGSPTQGHLGLYCFEQAAAPIATPVPGTGDGNNDGRVNLIDLSVLLTDFNKTGGFRPSIDLNGDGVINTFDFSLMRNLLIQNKVIKG